MAFFHPKMTWYRRLALTITLLAIPVSVAAQKSWLSFFPGTTRVQENAKPVMKFISRGPDGYVIDYEFPGATLKKITEGTTPYTSVTIDQFKFLQDPGRPALPARQFTFAVPLGHRASVRLISCTTTEHNGYTIYPARKPATDNIGAVEPPFEIDDAFYKTDRLYPAEQVTLAEEAVYRGNKIIRVQVCPVQFNPAQLQLVTSSKLRFEVRFIPEEASPLASYRPSRSSQQVLSNIADNGSMVISLNADITALQLDQSDDIPHPAGGMVIVTVDDFLSAAEAIAQWKQRMGYNVEIISQPAWATSEAVKEVIHDRYSTMPEGLDFALILGDHQFVPSELSTLGSYSHVTDLYFACMDGTGDFTPDIGIGRIPAESLTDASTMADKIISYERNPVTNDDFFRHGLSAAYFQHAGGGYAERRFAQTSWEIRQYLVNNYNYDMDRQFVTGSTVNPLYWNDGYYSNGEAIPDYLRRPNFEWDGNAAAISAGINEGRFLVIHRDHGSETSWGDPAYSVSNINALNNGNLLPVVLSINCLTGKFDYSGTCFSEAFIRHGNGGAVGVVCASQISYSGQNDGFAEGLVDAIWPDPGLIPAFPHNPSPGVTPHNPIYQMGLVLLQGKIRMTETWNGNVPPFNYEQYSYELFHYFGDPSMRIWTNIPQDITASFPVVLMLGQSTYDIVGASCGEGIATLWYDGQIIGSCELSGGNGQMNIEPLPTQPGTAELTITGHNCRPLEETINVIPGGDALFITAPTAGTIFDQGEVTEITWQTFGTIPEVTIAFSQDGGATFATIEPSITNNNSYTWTIPNAESDQCVLQIADIDGDPVGTSHQFSIHNLSLISGLVNGNVPAIVDYEGPLNGSVTTDGTGNFSINRLLPGTYDLSAQDGEYLSDVISVVVPPDRTDVMITILYPSISVSPESLTEALAPGATSTQTFTISNPGTADLAFSTQATEMSSGSLAPPDAMYPASHFAPLAKDATDERVGITVSDGQGGPDTYGYYWIDSDEPGGPAYTWSDISGSGTRLSTVSGCDDCSQSVSLSFAFNYYGDDYNSFNVSSNGYITFGASASSYTNYPLPSALAPAGLVGPFFDDLNPGTSGNIYFQDFGTYAVIQFDDVVHYGTSSGGYTYQIHLLENGRIRFYYNAMNGSLNSATVGWQNSARDDGLTVAYNTAYIHDNLAIEIASSPDWLLVSPESGTIAPGASQTVTVTFDATELAEGMYHGQVEIRHNDPNATDPLNVPCDLTVSVGNLPPTAVATADPESGVVPFDVSFDGSGSSDPNGDPLSYAWDFGDGTSGTGVTPSHTYTTPGTYNAVLTVADGNGATDDTMVTITANAVNRPPVARATATPLNGETPLSVLFDGSASTDPDGHALSYAWDFGDGATGSGATVSHMYTTAGTFTASLTVDDGYGGSDNVTLTITTTSPAYQPGLVAEFFNFTSSLSSLPDLSSLSADIYRIDDQINYPSTDNAWNGLTIQYEDMFASRHTGFIYAPANGTYTFYLNSDDGSALWINGNQIIDNDGIHAMQEASATVSLEAGYHPIRVEFFENDGGAGLVFSWEGPGFAKEIVPPSALFNNDDMNFPPVASLEATPASGTVPLTVAFDGSGSTDPDGDELTFLWEFGDGTSGSAATVSHTYTTVGTFTATLTVDDGNGNTDVETIAITVNPEGAAPFLQSSGSDGIVSMESEHFHNNTSRSGKDWIDTTGSGYSGDGAMVTSPNTGTYYNTDYTSNSPQLDFEVEFVHTGIHYIWARGIGSSPNDDSYHAGLDGTGSSSCDRISSFTTDWTWSRSTMDNSPATFNVSGTGVHTVNVWMREDGFIIDKIVITTDPDYTPSGEGPPESPRSVTNHAPTAAAWATPPDTGIVPFDVDFDGSASTDPDGDELTYAWDFGDGSTGSGVTVSHTYTTAGTFNATLTVDDGNGATDDTTLTITVINPNRPPVAAASATPDIGEVPLDVAFDGSTSTDPDGDELTYAWDFGDGSTGSGVTVSHMYTTIGTFDATLTVDDGNGASDDTTLTITVVEVPNRPPVAVMTADPILGDAPLIVSFDGSESTDPDGDVLLYMWDFGDGNSGDGPLTTHTYTAPGSYTATLTVTDVEGAANSVDQVITVTDPSNNAPTAVFEASPLAGTVPLTVAFDGSSSTDPDGDTLTFQWDFGDGSSGGGMVVNYTFTAIGTFDVILLVDDRNGGTDDTTITITVSAPPNEPPVAAASATPDNGEVPLDVAFDGSESTDPDGDDLTYAWDFGDGTTGTGVTVSHTYTTVGTFDATLTVDDGNGATDATSLTITVIEVPNQPPIAAASATPDNGAVPLDVAFDGSASTDPDGDALTFSWDFGDGTSGSGITVNHTYTAAAVYTVTLTVADGRGGVDETTLTIDAFDGEGPFLQGSGSDGIVAMEIEHFHDNISRSGIDWVTNSSAGFSGDGAMVTSPNTGTYYNTDYVANSPHLDFEVAFVHTGTHYIWARGIGGSPNDDSYHAGLDGAAISSCDRISSFGTDWTWSRSTMDNSPATFNLSETGVHTVNVWMREDGFIIDKIVITTDPNYTPSGMGPQESPRSGGINSAPSAVIDANPTGGTVPLPVSFDGSGSTDPDGDALIYAWDFGDGTSGSGATASHTYTATGTYTATLTVDDGNGGTDDTTVTISVTMSNDPPTVVTPAAATPDPVSGISTSLSVLGDDDGGEMNLTYTWSAVSGPASGSASFSVNGTNSAKNTTATFSAAGEYTLEVTITDAGALSVTSSVTVTVIQTLTSISVSPASVTVTVSETQTFTAEAIDQFGNPMSSTPSITWSVSGGGIINTTGVFTAGATAGGPYTVTATADEITGTGEVTIEDVINGIYIYDDVLADGYANYSWGTSCNFSDNDPLHDGTYSLAIDFTSGWAGLLLQKNDGVQSLSGFTAYSFWGHGGSSGTRRCQFFIRNGSGQESSRFEFELPANTWTQITIPLNELGNPNEASAIFIQDNTGTNQPEFNIDNLMLR